MALFGFCFNNAGHSSRFFESTVCLSAVEMAQPPLPLQEGAKNPDSCSVSASLSSEPTPFWILAIPAEFIVIQLHDVLMYSEFLPAWCKLGFEI